MGVKKMKKIVPFMLSLILLAACASIPKNLTLSEKEFLSKARYIIAKEEEQAFLSLSSASERENAEANQAG